MPSVDLNVQMKEMLDEIYKERWSLLLQGIVNVKLVALLKKVSDHAVFENTTGRRADYILDAFEQRFKGRSLFLWSGDKIVGRNKLTSDR